MASGIQVEIASAQESFRWNHAALREMLIGHNGPIFRDLVKRAIKIEAAAKINASHPTPSVPGEGPAVRTGRLRGSITWRIGDDFAGPYADIGSSVLYAPFVEFGTVNMQARPFLRPALNAGRF
jgi:HK97 gp10 family phage protein